MASFEKIKLSGANNFNRPILMWNALLMNSRVTVHSTGTSSTVIDEVWLWVSNPSTATRTIRCIASDTTNTIFQITDVPAKTTVLVLGGVPFKGDGSIPMEVKVDDAADVGDCYAYGYVNRITP